MCWYNELRYPLSPLRGTFPQGESDSHRDGLLSLFPNPPGNAASELFIPSPARLAPCHLPRGGRHFRTGMVYYRFFPNPPGNAASELFIPSPSCPSGKPPPPWGEARMRSAETIPGGTQWCNDYLSTPCEFGSPTGELAKISDFRLRGDTTPYDT